MICHYLQEAVVRRWPSAKYSAIGGFLFLRFICPSLLTLGELSEKPGTLLRTAHDIILFC
jgi:hypothetical protein